MPRYPVPAPPVTLNRRQHQLTHVFGDSFLGARHVSVAHRFPEAGDTFQNFLANGANGHLRLYGAVGDDFSVQSLHLCLRRA